MRLYVSYMLIGTLWNIKNEMGVNIELNKLFANGNVSKPVEEW